MADVIDGPPRATQCYESIEVEQMELKVTTGHFNDKRDAIREISSAGWWPISWRDAPGETYEAHKHDADQTLYLIEGFMELGVGADTYRLNPGDKLELPAFTVHSARTPGGATYIIGMPKVDLLSEHMLAPEASLPPAAFLAFEGRCPHESSAQPCFKPER